MQSNSNSDKYKNMFDNPWIWCYIAVIFISTVYSSVWDLVSDFGLFKVWKGENIFLRENLVYPKVKSSGVSLKSLSEIDFCGTPAYYYLYRNRTENFHLLVVLLLCHCFECPATFCLGSGVVFSLFQLFNAILFKDNYQFPGDCTSIYVEFYSLGERASL